MFSDFSHFLESDKTIRKTNWKSYAIFYFQMHNCITCINFFREHVPVILLSFEVSLDTLIFLCSPHPVLFSFICEITSCDKLELCESSPRLYSIWNVKKLLASENVGLMQCSPKTEQIPFFFLLLIVVWELRFLFLKNKKKREREVREVSSFLCFPVAAWSTFLCLPHVLMWKILANNTHLFIL